MAETRVIAIQAAMDDPEMDDEHEDAMDLLPGDPMDPDLDPEDPTLDNLYDPWFAFDRTRADGRRLVDRVLEEPGLLDGERRWLQHARDARLGIYEATAVVPGRSLTLRDIRTQRVVTVTERTASRTVHRWDMLATRVLPSRRVGNWELDNGLLLIPAGHKKHVLDYLERVRGSFDEEPLDEGPDAFERSMPIFVAEIYKGLMRAELPTLQTTDGEEVVPSRVHFAAEDAGRLARKLDAVADLDRDEGQDAWTWSKGDGTILGAFRLQGERLVFEAVSRERAERGRALVEEAAGDSVRHLATEHEDVWKAMEKMAKEPPGDKEELPPEVVAAALAEHYDKYYTDWLDEPVPALDGATPRKAAASPALRPRLVDLLREFDNAYHRSLASGQPAYEPTMLWQKLGLEGERGDRKAAARKRGEEARLPPLGHEALEEQVPGVGLLARQVAARFRENGEIGEADTLDAEVLSRDLPLIRFLQEFARRLARGGMDPDAAADEANLLAEHLHYLVNFELHRRKLFQVGEAVAWMLGRTSLDLPGDQLRPPFPAFAMVFTDRPTLALAEGLVARDPDICLRGQILEMLTAYVVREGTGDTYGMRLALTFHGGGDDWPYLLGRDLWVEPTASIEAIADSRHPEADPRGPDPQFDSPELASLVRLVLNAMLFATSPHSHQERRPLREARGHVQEGPEPVVSDEVYYLPGHIDIGHVHQLHEVSRRPDGAKLMHRFMVRGHWRRANPSWKDQRPRWIEPYWKGPDLAAVIERKYRLRED